MEAALYHPVQIGNRIIPGNLFIAPMAGYSDTAFRKICRRYGAVLGISEMISAEGIFRGNTKSLDLAHRAEDEEFWAVQIFASRIKSAAAAVKAITPLSPTFIDLNCGCPVPKIVSSGSGSALLKNPKLVGLIIRAMRQETDIPITIKIRSGWDNNSINYLETAGYAVSAGASLVTIHGRTRAQGYSGYVNKTHIYDLAKTLDVPVFASGDLNTPRDAHTVLSESECTGIMFARGCLGNPFIFKRTISLCIENVDPGPPEVSEIVSAAVEHLSSAIRYKGEYRACREMRKHISAYTKGIPGSASLRRDLVRASTFNEYISLLESILLSRTMGKCNQEGKKGSR
jgi:nifR3 family TIM-barrel protein